jgi:hypothetical protein
VARNTRKCKNILLVEGDDDKRVIPYFIEANGIDWGKRNEEIVDIRAYDGYENLIKPKEISTALKDDGLVALGILVDADEHPVNRWESVRNACAQSIKDLPKELPPSGLIHTTADGIKFGVWIMLDNQMQGMLETFLTYLVPDTSKNLWQYAQTVVIEAQQQLAPFTSTHIDKANIHTWLAWQDPPGRQMHNAVKEKILQPNHPKAQSFVNWFCELYQPERRVS